MQRISDTTWLIIILAAGIGLRVAVLWTQFDHLAEDRDAYRAIAQHVAAGQGYLHPQTQQPTAYRPPAYTLIVAAILKTGLNDAGIAALHLVLGAGTILLSYATARRLGLSRFSLVAAAITAVDPLLLQSTTLVMTETLAAFLLALLFWTIAPNTDSNPPTNGRLLSVGLVFGLNALCRPTIWAFGALAAVWWILRRIGRQDVVNPLPILLGILLITSPWVVRNVIVLGRPILTTTHGGYTLLLGNNPVYYHEVVGGDWNAVWSGESLKNWQDGLEQEIQKHDPPITTEIARDRWMNDRAHDNIAAEPGFFLRASFLRLARGLWGVVPLQEPTSILGRILKYSVCAFYVIILADMILGLCSLKKNQWPDWMPAALLLVSFTLVHTCYWANMRMRTPLMPVIALFVAQGCWAIWHWRGRSLKTKV
ncbi:hypothetical protein Mal52_03050 [Symmachiella dynata]|uniref:Glycosyltransferase RgtA/B/C/D-like domain-containing protein n=1 Tax=Symmachiella dynata TaxID=2527995 RepID=A0A517ZHB0_9PLAN|nr:glycosyltransferase family 39 protein [Symmachiella dynata]QDU41851.1 hypothetical protein Mal52_03050 [Symmachiella dynata]